MIEQVMTYVVLPVGGFVWWMHQKQVTHYTRITVLEKLFEQTNLTHDREIKEIKDFGFEDFISSLGGFIGIFLGYSMFQIPQLLGRSADI